MKITVHPKTIKLKTVLAVGFGYVPLAYFPGFPFPEHLFPGSPGYPGIDRFDVFFYSKLNKYVHYSYVLKL